MKYNLLYAGKRPCHFYFAYAVSKGNPKKTKFGIGGPIILDSENEIATFIYIFKDRNIPLDLIRRYTENKKLIYGLKEFCFDNRKGFEKNLKIKDIKNISDKEILMIYGRYINLLADNFSTIRALRTIDKGGVELLMEMIGKKIDNADDVITILTAPEEYTLVMEEELETIRRALKINERKDKKAVRKAAEQLLKKYAFCTMGFHDEPARDINHYEESIRKLLENRKGAEKRLKEIEEGKSRNTAERKKLEKGLDGNINHLAKVLRICAFLKDYNKMSQNLGSYLFEPIFTEMARRSGKSAKEVKNLLYPEAKKLLEEGKFDIDLIKKRSKKYFVLCDEKSIKEYYGNDAEAMEREYLGKTEKTGQNEFRGRPASKGFGKGIARIIRSMEELKYFREGEILIANNTTPDFVPAMKKASAIITEEGGVTCHAAVVSRELGVPCVLGIENATEIFKDGDIIEVDANKGIVRKIKK